MRRAAGFTTALEISTLTNRSHAGIGRYAARLLSALAALQSTEHFDLVGIYAADRWRKRERLATTAPGIAKRPWHALTMGPWRYDLVHSTGRWLPTAGRAPRVVTVHDLIAQMGPEFTTADEQVLQAGFHDRVARHADQIIFVSEATRDAFMNRYAFERARTHVVHLGVEPRFFDACEASEIAALRRRYADGQRYLLFVGSIKPNKNLARLLSAYAGSPVCADYRLVIAGNTKNEDVSRLVPPEVFRRIEHRVSFAGYIDDHALPGLYAAADAVLFPSLCEGFGLPILEAMASGTPVLTSTLSSCPEIAAGHATLVDPFSVDAIGAGLPAVLQTSLSAREAARDYARTKTWEATAAQTVNIYRAALTHRGLPAAAWRPATFRL